MAAWIERTTAATAATDVGAIGPVADDLFQQFSPGFPLDVTPPSVPPGPRGHPTPAPLLRRPGAGTTTPDTERQPPQ